MVARKQSEAMALREAQRLLEANGARVRHAPVIARLDRIERVFGRVAFGRRNTLTGTVLSEELWRLAGLPYPDDRTQTDNWAVGKKMKELGWERKIILKSGKVPYPVYQKGTAEEREVQIYFFENLITRNIEIYRDPRGLVPVAGTVTVADLIQVLPPID
jgi:hypothetical protein